MKENKLAFMSEVLDDNVPIQYSEEQVNAMKKAYSDFHMAFGLILSSIDNNSFTENMKGVCCASLENYTMDFLNQMGYSDILEKEKKQRHSEIRGLNEQNRELRRQLGDKVSNEDVREKLKNICTQLRAYFKSYGFFMREIGFTEYGSLKFKLNCDISLSYSDDEEPEELNDKIKELGFDTHIHDKRYIYLLNTPKSYSAFGFITDKFPSADITEYKVQPHDGVVKIDEIEIYLRDLNDIK